MIRNNKKAQFAKKITIASGEETNSYIKIAQIFNNFIPLFSCFLKELANYFIVQSIPSKKQELYFGNYFSLKIFMVVLTSHNIHAKNKLR